MLGLEPDNGPAMPMTNPQPLRRIAPGRNEAARIEGTRPQALRIAVLAVAVAEGSNSCSNPGKDAARDVGSNSCSSPDKDAARDAGSNLCSNHDRDGGSNSCSSPDRDADSNSCSSPDRDGGSNSCSSPDRDGGSDSCSKAGVIVFAPLLTERFSNGCP